jgi:hypothetical protein
MVYTTEDVASRGPFLKFHPDHPSDLLRLQQHRVMLEHLGWWSEFSKVESHYISILNKCQTLKEDEFGIMTDRGDRVGLATRSTFFNVIATVHTKVNSLFAGLDSGAQEFEALSGTVEQYLWNGVVPSTIFDKLALRYPRTTTLLNTAAKVHISSLDRLLVQLLDGDPSSPKNRSEWTTQLELWTIKALEDSVILERVGRTWG